MNSRRRFFRDLGIFSALLTLPGLRAAEPPVILERSPSVPTNDRDYWLAMLQRVADPVLSNLAAAKLRERMPVECPTGNVAGRRKVTHLEAIGRTLSGLAPWLELEEKATDELALSGRLADFARKGLTNATDPQSPDYINFTAGAQCLVDAAFLAHALLRAPRELWGKLDKPAQQRLVAALKSTRDLKAGQSNWLLFPAMIETFLASIGEAWQPERIDTAMRAFENWYVGDGVYGDGAEFHWDYYNSYVIQPFLIDVLEHIGKVSNRWAGAHDEALRRARRYAAVQERLIAPDGSYPVLGRSMAYRCGAFQLLGQMALRRELPGGVEPSQVRAALTAVMRRTLEAPGTFDADGWLRVGLAGHQPALAEPYISTGSLYLCALVFLPLGLPAGDPFWSAPATDWTSRKAWSGQDLPADHALNDARNARK
ncbi:MAG: DUF2264 domain-containing protein [Verrucomicrobiia bacterium]